MKLPGSLLKSTVVAGLGGLLFGFDTAVISGTTRALTQVYNLTPHLLGVTVASALAGTVIGAMFAGVPGDRLGRRDSLRWMAVFYLVSALGSALAWNWDALLAARFIGGLGIGGSSVLAPMYIAEIAPAQWRGRLVGFFQFNVVFGILLAYFSNYLVGLAGLSGAEWRWKFGVAGFPAAIFLLMLFTIPRSPRWLAKKGRVDEARAVLQLTGDHESEHDLQEILQSLQEGENGGNSERLFTWRYRFPIFIAVTMGMFNQLEGINAILYYLNDIFSKAGFGKVSGDLQAVAVGATNLIFTIIAMSLIDKAGRKTLLLIGAVGNALCLAGISAIFALNQHQDLLLWLLIAYIACFAFAQGAVIWVYIGEVFPTQVRAKGQSLGSFSHWIMNFAISLVFPVVAARSGAWPFMFFTAVTVVQFFVVLFVYPETKGLTLEEMQHRLGITP
jgi:MFS transporter, SP family, arabinose:H+ symporter